ncbi:hypothetical protein [Rhodovulum sp. MB263]|uniref:hypothetical protein n=1 Tax=unclassified Rhodovulum TaxID=2631432 RepID=UPI0009B7AE82|nr:hypothetical protein [Rhodovulum sp. MB263]ARC88632.1 hypothetical protein B5V46_08385 [Rhodovulum sp. MB263]
MKLFDILRTFAKAESGTATVDWVVLTAAIIGLGIAVLATFGPGVNDLGDSFSESRSGASVAERGTLGWSE